MLLTVIFAKNLCSLVTPAEPHSLAQSTLQYVDTFPRYTAVFPRQLTTANLPPCTVSLLQLSAPLQDSVTKGDIWRMPIAFGFSLR